MDQADMEILSSYLSPIIDDDADWVIIHCTNPCSISSFDIIMLCVACIHQSWEDMTDTALMYLLRTLLAKSAKEQGGSAGPVVAAKDTAKLKKHILNVFERLGKTKLSQAAAVASSSSASASSASSVSSK
jgi:hypothetical protein